MKPAALAPPPERFQHGRVEQRTKTLPDSNGGIGRPYTAEDLLGRLERRGDISPAQRAAGEHFLRWWTLAGLNPLRAAPLVPSGGKPHGLPSGVPHARRRLHNALQALGGQSSPAGCCAWFVLGEQLSLAAWARREAWSGRPLREEVAKGILLATLSCLAAHFRTEPRNGD